MDKEVNVFEPVILNVGTPNGGNDLPDNAGASEESETVID